MQSRKSLLAKIFGVLCALCCVVALAFGVAACDSNTDTTKSVVNVSVVDGQLVIDYSDGSKEEIDLGDLKGEQGPAGDDGDKGEQGVGITSVTWDETKQCLVITYTDGKKQEVKVEGLGGCECPEPCEHENISTWVLSESYEYNAATDTYKGTLLEVCDDCGYAWLTTDAEHQQHVWKDVAAVEPTCCTDGHEAGQECEICGKFQGGEVKPATGNHVWDEGHLVYTKNENACEQGGVYIYLCKGDPDCTAYKISEDEEIRGHKVAVWYVDTDKAPSLTETGILSGACTECDETVTLTLPKLNDTDYAKKQISNLENNCQLDTDYTYTYTMAAGTVTEIDGIKIEGKTTVEYTGTTAFTWTSGPVTVKGGNHYALNMYGEEEPIEIDKDGYAMVDAEKGILWYPDMQVFGNITYTCQETITPGDGTETTGAVYFDCEHCKEHIYARVNGYHTVGGKLVTYIYDEDGDLNPLVTKHEATCSNAEYYTVNCDECDKEVVVRGCGIAEHATNKTHYAADVHVVPEDVTITGADGQDIDPEAIKVGDTVTIKYECELCEAEQTVSGNVTATEPIKDDPTTPCLDEGVKITVEYTVNGEKHTEDVPIVNVGDHHTIINNGIEYSLTAIIDSDSGLANIKVDWTDAAGKKQHFEGNTIESNSPLASLLEFFGNVPETCKDKGAQAFIDCDVCNTHLLVMYQVAHTPTLNAQGQVDYTLAGCFAPTCTQPGKALCSVCKENFEYGEALGHTYVIDKYEYKSTVTTGNNFTLKFHCTKCEEYGTAEQPTTIEGNYAELVKKGYIDPVQEQSCAKDLIINVNCPVDLEEPEGDRIVAEGLNLGKLAHHFKNGNVLDTELKTVYNIDEYNGLIELFGNVPVNCKDDTGYGFTYCRDCDMRILIRVSGHHTKPADGEPVEEASCTSPAVYQCKDCQKYFYGVDAGDAIVEHKYVLDAKASTPANNDATGTAVYKCSLCGDTHNVTLPKLSETDKWNKVTVSDDCEHGTQYSYSYVIPEQEITVNYKYTDNGANLSGQFKYKVNLGTYTFLTEPTGVGHDEYVEGKTLVYSWVYPEDEDGILYVGYICKCGTMIVLWNESMGTENTYEIDVELDSLIPGVVNPPVEDPDEGEEGGDTPVVPAEPVEYTYDFSTLTGSETATDLNTVLGSTNVTFEGTLGTSGTDLRLAKGHLKFSADAGKVIVTLDNVKAGQTVELTIVGKSGSSGNPAELAIAATNATTTDTVPVVYAAGADYVTTTVTYTATADGSVVLTFNRNTSKTVQLQKLTVVVE